MFSYYLNQFKLFSFVTCRSKGWHWDTWHGDIYSCSFLMYLLKCNHFFPHKFFSACSLNIYRVIYFIIFLYIVFYTSVFSLLLVLYPISKKMWANNLSCGLNCQSKLVNHYYYPGYNQTLLMSQPHTWGERYWFKCCSSPVLYSVIQVEHSYVTISILQQAKLQVNLQ